MSNVDTVRKFYDCFNRQDLDGALKLMAEDCTFLEMPIGAEMKGKEAVKQLLGMWHQAYTGARIDVKSVVDAGKTCVMEGIGSGKNEGPFGPYLATHKKAEIQTCDVVEFDDQGKIKKVRSYWDLHRMLAQLGHAVPFEAPKPAVARPAARPEARP
jgi:steroid delta-isomerase-like uncharacterized protein